MNNEFIFIDDIIYHMENHFAQLSDNENVHDSTFIDSLAADYNKLREYGIDKINDFSYVYIFSLMSYYSFEYNKLLYMINSEYDKCMISNSVTIEQLKKIHDLMNMIDMFRNKYYTDEFDVKYKKAIMVLLHIYYENKFIMALNDNECNIIKNVMIRMTDPKNNMYNMINLFINDLATVMIDIDSFICETGRISIIMNVLAIDYDNIVSSINTPMLSKHILQNWLPIKLHEFNELHKELYEKYINDDDISLYKSAFNEWINIKIDEEYGHKMRKNYMMYLIGIIMSGI